MGRHGVAKPVLADHQPLVGQAADNAGQPAVGVHQSEDDGRHDKGKRMELAERHSQEIKLHEVAVKE